ncbi:MAG: hypothetical protein GX895_11280 [Clostridiales bacterium]|nr:hypothetical protein [Clostridiales bacterium]
MSLYTDWINMVVNFVKQHGEDAFWQEYGRMETKIYTYVLANFKEPLKGTIAELAKKFDTTQEFFMGYLDGLNESLKESYDLEKIEADDVLTLDIDFEKLYFNMLDAKADYLYSLPQWDGIFSVEKRKEIHKAWKDSKTVVKENKIGRNDPCPCGSGKKYKKCCGNKAANQ